MTFDASHVKQDGKFTQIDEVRPINGDYLNSNPPAQVLGCSVHWFEEHPTFRNGGLVALAEYENGTRFLQIQPDGKIKEQGYFIPLGGSTSAPHWAPNSNVLYAIDYERGIDVLRYKGSLYVPDEKGAVTPEPGAAPGTEGRQPGAAAQPAAAAAVCATEGGFDRIAVRPKEHAHASGSADAHASDEGLPGPGLRFTVTRRQQRPFDVDVFQVSSGRRVIGERRVARFRDRTGSFSWDGRKGLRDGAYFVRFTMRLANGAKDVRRFTLRRSRGDFANAPAHYARDTCGALRSFKLSRPVFGGTRGTSLGVAYQLTNGVDSVSVVALRGTKVIKRFTGLGTARGRTYRVSLPSRGIPRGRDVKIRVEIVRANAKVTSTLTSRRL